MNLGIEVLSDQQITFAGFVKNDAVAMYIPEKSIVRFYVQSAIRCAILQLNFGEKDHFWLS